MVSYKLLAIADADNKFNRPSILALRPLVGTEWNDT